MVDQPTFKNLAELEQFDELTILDQLERRYAQRDIYTYIGTILVSVNPYQFLEMYDSTHVALYENSNSSGVTPPPHVYAIAAAAYSHMFEDECNQSIVISGESGAGKTEVTKTILQYFSAVAGSTSGVEHEIQQSNPLLEAFGNSKTTQNNNSSRFGKWMEVEFEPSGRIGCAHLESYLLEKSRVTKVVPGERNYHIFYQLLVGFLLVFFFCVCLCLCFYLRCWRALCRYFAFFSFFPSSLSITHSIFIFVLGLSSCVCRRVLMRKLNRRYISINLTQANLAISTSYLNLPVIPSTVSPTNVSLG